MKLRRAAIIGCIVICVFATSAQAAQMSIEPAYQEVFQGDNVTIDIKVYPEASEVYSASYTLYFNNTLLNATSWVQGPFLKRDGNSSNLWKPVIDNTLGKVEYAESRTGTDVGIGGAPGVLTTITFQAIGVKGVSPLNITDLDGELLYSTSGPIPIDINNGTCKIEDITGQTPTPTPTTTIIVQTPTATSTTPTPAATAVQTLPIPSMPSPSPTVITSPVRTAAVPKYEEPSEENNGLSGFQAAFAVSGLLAVLILKRNTMR